MHSFARKEGEQIRKNERHRKTKETRKGRRKKSRATRKKTLFFPESIFKKVSDKLSNYTNTAQGLKKDKVLRYIEFLSCDLISYILLHKKCFSSLKQEQIEQK